MFKSLLSSKDQKLKDVEKQILGQLEVVKRHETLIDVAKSIIPTGINSLPELLRWFKQDFFTWMNNPPCSKCQSKNTRLKSVERLSHAVEVYECSDCGTLIEFHRYNDAEILLKTKTGRCGEWANAFTLCCRARGWKTRHVYDFSDHVWTEVLTPEGWMHLDPCEEVMDKPWLYEKGWGKRLYLVIAVSIWEIKDLTLKYTQNHQELPNRRLNNGINEESLQRLIADLNKRFLPKMPDDVASAVEKIPPLPKEEVFGRNSGSLEWRLSRGEISLVEEMDLRKADCDISLNLSEYRLNGSALLKGQEIILTQDCTDQLSSVYYPEPLPLNQGLSLRLSFELLNFSQVSLKADGFALIWHANPLGPKALGDGGSGLGYQGISHSEKRVALEVDWYQSVDRCNDPPTPHLSLHTRQELPNTAHHRASLAAQLFDQNSDSLDLFICITRSGVFTVFIKFGEKWCPALSNVKVEAWNALFNDDNWGWFGLTASTGGLSLGQILKRSEIHLGLED